MAENISDPVLSDYATDTVNEINFDNFMQEKLDEIKWLSGKGFTEDQVDDILNDLKPAFEDSYFNKSDDEYPYDDWYDDFSEERIRPYLEARVEKLPDMPIENVGSAPDYAELVRDSVRKEFEAFKDNVMSKSAEDIFYHNYEIHVKTELMETIESYDFDEEYFRALEKEVDHGGILQNLYG